MLILFLKTKDEFLGMFFVELNLNIPYESPEQPMLIRDYPLLKRRSNFEKNFSIKIFLFFFQILAFFSVFVEMQLLDYVI